MASVKRKSRCVAVRNGKHTCKYLGAPDAPRPGPITRYTFLEPRVIVYAKTDEERDDIDMQEESTKGNGKLTDLDYILMKMMCPYFDQEDLINVFVIDPKFELAATDAYAILWRNGQWGNLKVFLSPKPHHARNWLEDKKVLSSFGMYIKTLKIVGSSDRQQLNEVDIDLMNHIVQCCPNVTHLTLELINSDEIGLYLTQFPKLSSVDFLFSSIGRHAVYLPNLTELVAHIGIDTCRLCMAKNYNIPHAQYVSFFDINPQLDKVALHVVRSKTCVNCYDVHSLVIAILPSVQRRMDACARFTNFRIHPDYTRPSHVMSVERGYDLPPHLSF